ncbi:ABC transporter permease [Nonomuraea sp. K274]|uniref:ABC transporter permease n=1 Tax=Nonomuraea cypriaca TaxID=1187855 RepID=A0A931A4E1_9ACTN|nr:ABC transporter permease [Nonomuraea cypriaca]MBF8184584.1 ABC transporter permease [Nonomuraea cypriaca]
MRKEHVLSETSSPTTPSKTEAASRRPPPADEFVIPPAPRPRGWRRVVAFYRRFDTVIHTVASLILGVVIWQLVAERASQLVIVPLGAVWTALQESLNGGQLLTDFGASVQGFAIGLVLSAVFGIAIGVVMAMSKVVFDFLDIWVSALYSTPLIALAPLFVIVFGIGLQAKIAVVISLAIFPVIINTAAGIRTTDEKLVETAYSFGANRRQIFAKVMLPWAVPFIVTGLRLAVGRALIGVVVAEFFGSTNGLGHAVFTASNNFDTAGVWLGVFILAAIGMILIRLMHTLERWVAPWRQSKVQ